MRILLVEDDESIREVFQLILEAEQPLPQLEVQTASSGSEALERAKAARPDLVLLDMTLANEDGFEVFHKLRALETCADLPVVAVTAHNLRELETRAINMGFAGFVTKPIDFEKTLFPLLREICRPAQDKSTHVA